MECTSLTRNNSGAFALWRNSNGTTLFDFGCYDAYIMKQNSRSSSKVHQQSYFNYHGISNALIGRMGNFNPKRITVIQMK